MNERYLFVWEDVFCDYTSGIAFALAGNLDEAHQAIGEVLSEWMLDEIKRTNPRVVNVKENYANGVIGGG